MPRYVSQPKFHVKQAVDNLGANDLLPVSRPVEGGNYLRPQKVFLGLPVPTVAPYIPITLLLETQTCDRKKSPVWRGAPIDSADTRIPAPSVESRRTCA